LLAASADIAFFADAFPATQQNESDGSDPGSTLLEQPDAEVESTSSEGPSYILSESLPTSLFQGNKDTDAPSGDNAFMGPHSPTIGSHSLAIIGSPAAPAPSESQTSHPCTPAVTKKVQKRYQLNSEGWLPVWDEGSSPVKPQARTPAQIQGLPTGAIRRGLPLAGVRYSPMAIGTPAHLWPRNVVPAVTPGGRIYADAEKVHTMTRDRRTALVDGARRLRLLRSVGHNITGGRRGLARDAATGKLHALPLRFTLTKNTGEEDELLSSPSQIRGGIGPASSDDNLISPRLAFPGRHPPATAITDRADDFQVADSKAEAGEQSEGVGNLRGGRDGHGIPPHNSRTLRPKKRIDYAKFDVSTPSSQCEPQPLTHDASGCFLWPRRCRCMLPLQSVKPSLIKSLG
jgi:hypothetical protein